MSFSALVQRYPITYIPFNELHIRLPRANRLMGEFLDSYPLFFFYHCLMLYDLGRQEIGVSLARVVDFSRLPGS